MVKACYVRECSTNKLRRHNWTGMRPALFSFPKSPDILDKWKKSIPILKRDPRPSDCLCSLHFKHVDILKYFEISGLPGQPKDKVERTERCQWSLLKDAVPHYFNNDNPEAELVLREVKHRKKVKDHNYNQSDPTQSKLDLHCPGMYSDHSLYLAAQTHSEEGESRSTELQTPLYTVEDLHEDALDLILPQKWGFMQNINEDSTIFLLCKEDMSVERSVRFLGSCHPHITVKGHIVNHQKITSREEIEDLIQFVDRL